MINNETRQIIEAQKKQFRENIVKCSNDILYLVPTFFPKYLKDLREGKSVNIYMELESLLSEESLKFLPKMQKNNIFIGTFSKRINSYGLNLDFVFAGFDFLIFPRTNKWY